MSHRTSWSWVFLIACLLLPVQASGSTPIFKNLEPYSVQMHIHGLSNHNGSAFPASMQLQSSLCNSVDLDVVWWADHSDFFSIPRDVEVQLNRGVIPPGSLHVSGLELPDILDSDNVTRLSAKVNGGTPEAHITPQGLFMSLTSSGDRGWQEFSYRAEGEKGLVRGALWPRKITTGARLIANLDFEPGNQDVAFHIVVHLAWHHFEDSGPRQHIIDFEFVPADRQEEKTLTSPNKIKVFVPVNPANQRYELDLLEIAGLLPDGTDNMVSSISFVLKARKGKKASALIHSFSLENPKDIPETAELEAMVDLAETYATRYGTAQYFGFEFGENLGIDKPPSKHHMNAYFPGASPPDLSFLDIPHTPAGQARLSRMVSQAGGITSLNHIFGTHQNTTPRDRKEKERYTRAIFQDTLKRRAYGATVLEVGYLSRAGANLRDHLNLWDKFTANGLFLVGNGTTDSHGNRQYPKLYNPFATWIWARDVSAPALINGLRQGRVCFGDPNLWNGRFAFRVGQVTMGQRATIQEDRSILRLEFTPWPEDMDVYLVQGLMGDGYRVSYIHERTPVSQGATRIKLDTRKSSFVRLEVYRKTSQGAHQYSEGQPVVFTNPVVLWR